MDPVPGIDPRHGLEEVCLCSYDQLDSSKSSLSWHFFSLIIIILIESYLIIFIYIYLLVLMPKTAAGNKYFKVMHSAFL